MSEGRAQLLRWLWRTLIAVYAILVIARIITPGWLLLAGLAYGFYVILTGSAADFIRNRRQRDVSKNLDSD